MQDNASVILGSALAAPLWPTRLVGRGRPPPRRLTGAPSEPPPNERGTMGEDACTLQLRAPRIALSEHSRRLCGAHFRAALRGAQ
eukprot:15458917-Alexandrium_andersonii.AAC.1